MEPKDGKFYVFEKKDERKPSKLVLAVMIILLAAWIAGLVLIFIDLSSVGIPLWSASIIGMVIFYFVRRNDSTLNEVREAEMLAGAKPLDESVDEADSKGEAEDVKSTQTDKQ